MMRRLEPNSEDASTRRLKGYADGAALPSPETLKVICRACELSWVEAFNRAGYAREFFKVFDSLSRPSQALGEADARLAIEGVCQIAIVFFPLRGERLKRYAGLKRDDPESYDAWFQGFYSKIDGIIEDVPLSGGKLARWLQLALDALEDQRSASLGLTLEQRKFIAAEYVRAWTLKIGGTYARDLVISAYGDLYLNPRSSDRESPYVIPLPRADRKAYTLKTEEDDGKKT